MSKIALIFFIGFELCYYLLIAQTGIVEYFSSDIVLIAPLAIGGIIGSILSYKIKTKDEIKIRVFLVIQLLMTLFYPNYNAIGLFILGISVGALAPLIINELKKASMVELGFALCLSYSVGTLLFNYEPAKREYIAILFTLIVLFASFYLPKNPKKIKESSLASHSFLVMVLWIFLDSALFETLSRDLTVSIWRGGFTLEIVAFHILGVILAFKINLQKVENELFIIILFALSYLFYFLREPLLLSIVYPFVISYYNVNILKTLRNIPLSKLSIYMIVIGWLASGAGLFVALEDLILFVPIIFCTVIIQVLYTQKNIQSKEKKCIN
ncbi:hypothetical protein [Halarcobacter ebronensis]|uniref:MFS transporter n=1 Tax=Halarcobacter ebronensis TaxID=1462615 RepID=A0A4Q1AR64_9BACT|nr:hypothetical protein [Halarcobacter ebronensis]QKF83491.1 putative membrane protein [Halarcobacter ebronensis]RXK08287.1 hypothetical protein CRV07_00325 [Halarcobacter ebronensis]